MRGHALRVDLLAPRRGRSEKTVFLRRFNAAAQPLDFLDYLLEAPERAAIVDGGASLVNVPAPGRFALHKLIVAVLRPAAFQAKARKDIVQACEVFQVLVDERPGDLEMAWEALVGRGTRWAKTAKRGLALARRLRPDVHGRLAALLWALD